jgi:hypothetical protein
VQTGENEDEEKEEEQEDLGKGFNGGNDKKNNVRECVVGMIATSLQPSLKQKGGGHLLRILIKDSHHIIDIISKSKEPTHLLLLLLMPMQDSTTVT